MLQANTTYNDKKKSMATKKTLINIPSLDGLRGLAALMVVFSHAGTVGLFADIKFSGQLGVGLFFCLSGFLMAFLYGQKSWGINSVFTYGVRRFFRIYPAYLAVLTLSYLLVIAGSKFHFGIPVNYPYRMTYSVLLDHFMLNGSVGAFWTIPVEMKFYLIFPFLSAVIYWVPGNKYKITVTLILLLGCMFMEPKGNIISPWWYLEFFVGGMCAGYIFAFLHEEIRKYKRTVNTLFVLSLLGIFISIPRVFSALSEMVGYSGYYWNNMLHVAPPYFAPMMSLCVLCCALSTGVLNVIFSNRYSRYLGKISFSLYLTHGPCLVLVKHWFSYTPAMELFIALALSLVVSNVLFILIEDPYRRMGSRLATFKPKHV